MKLRLCVLLVWAAAAWCDDPPFPVISKVDARDIAGRPVQLDAAGKLLPWPMPEDTGYSYSSHVLTQWSILWDQHNRQRYHYFFCCFDFDRTTFEMQPDWHWANSTAYVRAMMQGFIERLYPFTGDPNTLTFLQDFVDYELENGQTPESYAWARVPYTSANPGDQRYTGWSSHGEDYLEPHVVGEEGYAYLRLYEMTGNTKYLQAAIRCADALVKNYKDGDADHSPWPVRCYARDGKVEGRGMGPYSANVVEPVMLFDELMRIGQGAVAQYKPVRQKAWEWLHQYPMKNNVWVGYFEDVAPSMDNMNQVIPLEYARYVLLNPEKDPDWRENARKLIDWVKTTPKWPKYIVHGATVTTEQGNGKSFCCNLPNQCCDSHTSRLAAVEALYYARTGDAAYKEQAFRSYNWVTYFQGMPAGAHAPWGANQWWFTDEFSDGPRRLMDAFWAVPEWAPADESHLLGSHSVVTKIAYGKGSLTYSTFDASSTDVLRLSFAPDGIFAGGRKLTRSFGPGMDLKQEGYTFDDATRVLRIRHDSARDVDVQGFAPEPVPLIVDFDNPHLGANAVLHGQYPSGGIDWGEGQWKISAPRERMSTFSLCVAGQEKKAQFDFAYARMFMRLDVYNPLNIETRLTISSPETPAISFTLKPRELRRIKTGWMDRSSSVTLESDALPSLLFDNLAYSPYLWGTPARP
ncbi:MAG TPA: hypothetical protein VKR61_18740 [Bryobacteraceae bacterium]|nr:hypothetical protein [Bryobacteraceae bacterium]